VKIKFSRHAKRRAKLYKILENTVATIIENFSLHEGNQEIVRVVKGFRYLIKVVIVVENDTCTVLTNYLLKKGRNHESTLR